MIIAKEMGVNIRITSGPAIEKQGDLASILTNLSEGDILFIDEIHRLKTTLEEILYSAMEDFALDLIIGKGPSARTMRMNLPRFTLVGATTKASMISSPLRDRFGHIYKLNFYNNDEMQEIVSRSAKILSIDADAGAASRIASCARATPRIANRLLKRVRDYAEFHGSPVITQSLGEKALTELGVDELGLDPNDRDILQVIIEKFRGGPVGLSTLSAAAAEDADTIEDVYEPYLMQIGFLERTHRGRVATRQAYDHLGIKWLEENAKKLALEN
jgi:Holliday junction DNA helicase RuvB